MADVLQDVPIAAPPAKVYEMLTTPAGLDAWWTKTSAGVPLAGTEYTLGFEPGAIWRARVTRADTNREFELEMVEADADWTGTRLGFWLDPTDHGVMLRFHHTGWRAANAHFRGSAHCWALYLRILRRHLERGESVPYENRLDA